MIEKEETSLEKVVEEIDIGGITLLRASAKISDTWYRSLPLASIKN